MRGDERYQTEVNQSWDMFHKETRRDLIIGHYQLSKGRSRCVSSGSEVGRPPHLRAICTCWGKPFSDTCISFANGYCRCRSGSHRSSGHKPMRLMRGHRKKQQKQVKRLNIGKEQVTNQHPTAMTPAICMTY
jgi:hypothetical protein